MRATASAQDKDKSKGGTTPWHYTWAGTYDNTLPYPGTAGATSKNSSPLVIPASSGWVSGACP